MQKRTKIVATIGPASDTVETLSALILAGVNVFRLNFSHGTHAYHSYVLANIHAAMAQTRIIVGILQDISGPKIRVGHLGEDFFLHTGDRLDLYHETIEGEKIAQNHYRLSLNQSDILAKVKIGEAIYLYDGLIRVKVIAKKEHYLQTLVENNGRLSSHKGVNFPSTHLGLNVLTPKDHEDIAWGIENGVDFMAISFVQRGEDMLRVRELVTTLGGRVELFAKIEKFDAIENLDSILLHSDGIMVARGDLGIEIPYHEIPSLQKRIIHEANRRAKPVITATQMLLSMTEKERATRAEISDVANAVLDGTDAVMLSEESAVGMNPVLAVETMTQTIQSIEKIYPYGKFTQFAHDDTMDVVNESAVRLGDSLQAEGIIAMTTSGQSAKKLSRYRPKMTIYAATHEDRVARLLTMVWGVVPAYMIETGRIEETLANVIQSGLRRGIMHKERTYIFTAGYPVGTPGTTNVIRILRENEMSFFGELKSKNTKKKTAVRFS